MAVKTRLLSLFFIKLIKEPQNFFENLKVYICEVIPPYETEADLNNICGGIFSFNSHTLFVRFNRTENSLFFSGG